uniref:hypothetical protein n=1 Tax=Nannocystis bainbridge TaxID=2995303 RepID=UPI00358DB09B
MHTETAAKLGLKVPADAPTLQFNTASGPAREPDGLLAGAAPRRHRAQRPARQRV